MRQNQQTPTTANPQVSADFCDMRHDGLVSIRLVDRKILWSLGGNRCAFPGCRQPLIHSGESDQAVVGEEAHIIARSHSGPRGDSDLVDDERDRHSNLILLCPTHHTIVDHARSDYPPDALRQMKAVHEQWVEATLGRIEPSPIELRYADIIQGWQDRSIDAGWWSALTSSLFTARMQVRKSTLEGARKCLLWLFNRRWPGTLMAIESEIRRFEAVLGDLLGLLARVLDETSEESGVLWFRPFYKHELNHERSDSLAREYIWIGELACDLGLELARCANSVCDAVIDDYEPLFRAAEGLVTVASHDLMFGMEPYRPTYSSSDERYTTLASYLRVRSTRDVHIGSGADPDGAARLGLDLSS